MKSSVTQRLMSMAQRLSSLDQKLSQPEGMNDLNQFRAMSQERAALAPTLALFDEYQQCQQQAKEAQGLLDDSTLGALAAEELARCEMRTKILEKELQRALLPKDPDDTRNVFLEIRAGTGGDESSLFAGDLLRMYIRFVERRGWRLEMVSQSPSEIGGYKEVILRILGDAAFAWMKFESGGHRVQRVPVTEAQGRVHTSACTVAVMPEADPVITKMPDSSELRIDTFRASGAGGQHVNRTDSAVRITHLPTGLVVECQDDRSQHRNKAQAMSVLLSRLQERNRQEYADRTAAARRLLIGTGDRSERIRTYNFPQNRVTDHRIHLTLHRIESIMDGDLEELVVALRLADEGERLKALEVESASEV